MKYLLRFWNLIHYCFYKLQLGFHKMIWAISPVKLMYKVPFMKRIFFRRTGIKDMADYADNIVFYNRQAGIAVKWAGIHMGCLFIVLLMFLLNLIQLLIKKDFLTPIEKNQYDNIIAILSLVIIAGIVNYHAIFKDKNYLKYFEEFEKIPQRSQLLYCFLCAIGYPLIVFITLESVVWVVTM